MTCPVCRDVSLIMSDRQGVEIDYCPSCRGIWLDRGELDKIIERSSTQMNNSYQEQSNKYNNSFKDYNKPYKKKKKESFLSEIFDF